MTQTTGTQTLQRLPYALESRVKSQLIIASLSAGYILYLLSAAMSEALAPSLPAAPYWMALLVAVPCLLWLQLALAALRDARRRARPKALHVMDVTPLVRMLLDDDQVRELPLWTRYEQRQWAATGTKLPSFKLRAERLVSEFELCEQCLKDEHGCRFEDVERVVSAPFGQGTVRDGVVVSIVILAVLGAIAFSALTGSPLPWAPALVIGTGAVAWAWGLAGARAGGLKIGIADALCEYLLEEPPAEQRTGAEPGGAAK